MYSFKVIVNYRKKTSQNIFDFLLVFYSVNKIYDTIENSADNLGWKEALLKCWIAVTDRN